MRITRRTYLKGTAGLAAAGMLGTPAIIRAASAQTALPNLASTMIWSTYDVGSTGYVEASAIADAFGKKFGSRVRLQPSGSAIGRVKPLTDGRVSHAWLANELFFSVEGLHEYCAADWGPQNLRTLMGRTNAFSVVATKVSGIKEPKDLKGKRFAIARANSSVNIKVEPILAFAGLTWDDVELIEFPSYGATMKGLIEGKADCAGVAPAAATLRELEASPNGIGWVALDPSNKEGWARAQKAVPFVEPFQETIGAGLSKDNPVWMMGYRYPMITVSADASVDEVYAMTRAVAETFDGYKDASPVMARWEAAKAGTPPMDAAFHDGAIKYLKEAGIWKPEHQTWQDASLNRHAKLQAAWADMMAKDSAAKSADPEALQKIWYPIRADVLKSL
ncbi:TAXI family TRAP transporter solute-binding subunit [Oceanibaculum sp.]|uniref:TAXI family TRAP transporter solute-binding subunit n=1 Tax=Oceanibaculum sp. TaxID=1903597 RepID=UPI0025903ED0|nr:TAXI family TRAP transporter solute-binding subunit [Oceanibaculum sp.]MCH2395066.1 TAXI family TRAP transporter solute-binding subunit [Oceanibaculum sp.]